MTTYAKFGELESRILRAVEMLKTTKHELVAAKVQVKQLEREVEELRRERDLVKNKVEILLENLSELSEEPDAETEGAGHRR